MGEIPGRGPCSTFGQRPKLEPGRWGVSHRPAAAVQWSGNDKAQSAALLLYSSTLLPSLVITDNMAHRRVAEAGAGGAG